MKHLVYCTACRMLRSLVMLLLLVVATATQAQVGEHRNDFSLGFNGGVSFNSIGFQPTVSQGMHKGFSGGLSMRYVCEKYFKTICSVMAEVNYTQLGWEEDILNPQEQPVINPVTGQAEEYKRTISYVQLPIMAHLAWGRERSGVQFFVQAGPQFGLYLSESTTTNFTYETRNVTDRSNKVSEQYLMSVENKFDYGIAAGLGMEYSIPSVGHFLLEGRYYYGLGNIYDNTKRDYFGKSNHQTIHVKLTYLFDITKTKI